MVNTALKHFGKLDILFNNAGIMHSADDDAINTDERMELQITDTLGYTLEADITSLFKRDIHAVYFEYENNLVYNK